MLKSFFSRACRTATGSASNPSLAFSVVAWTVAAFLLGQLALYSIARVLVILDVPLNALNSNVLNSIAAAVSYGLTLAIIIGLPWILKNRRTSRNDLGLTRLPTMADIILAPAAYIGYMAMALGLLALASMAPWIDLQQIQDVGFSALYDRMQLFLAFMTLVVAAPVAEEAIFRGYLYGKLRKSTSLWAAALITSVLFGVVHMQWNVGLDVFALSLVACWLREATGSIWSGILLHMIKNGLAFYFLFINPALLGTMGG